MLARIFKLSAFIGLVIVIGYLYHFNSQEITLVLGPDSTFTTRAAHAVLGLFLAGFLVASFFASILRLRQAFAMRSLRNEMKKLEEAQALVIEAHNLIALGDLKAAHNTLKKSLQKNPKNAHAGVLLSDVTKELEGPRAALDVLEKMRADKVDSAETFIAAAALNDALGNHTAAYDNIQLLLKRAPGNTIALQKAVVATASLERFEEAIELQEQLVHRASGDEYDAAQNQLARLKVRAAITAHEDDPVALKSALESIIKDHRDFPDALSILAELEESAGRRDTATKLRRSLFELTGDSIHLETIVRCWLAQERPDTALRQLQSAIADAEKHGSKDRPSPQLVEARLLLVHLLLHLEMVELAQSELTALESTEHSNEQSKLRNYTLAVAVLQARISSRTQNLANAFRQLVDTLDTSIPLRSGEEVKSAIRLGEHLESWAERLSQKIHAVRSA